MILVTGIDKGQEKNNILLTEEMQLKKAIVGATVRNRAFLDRLEGGEMRALQVTAGY